MQNLRRGLKVVRNKKNKNIVSLVNGGRHEA
jgi:hypothetical protein